MPLSDDAGRTSVCAVITRASPPLRDQVAQAVAADAELVELRVDMINDVQAVEALLRGPRPVPFILTIRPSSEGGLWDGDENERISLMERLGLLMPGYIDVELSAWKRSANLRQKIGLVAQAGPAPAAAFDGDASPSGAPASGASRPKNRLILSHHDFRETPQHLDALFDELEATPAAVIKAAFRCADTTDALRITRQLHERAARRPTIALGMGEAGLITRVLARKFGAFLTYACITQQDASAPGQITLDELHRGCRWNALNRATRVFGVVGWPVSHSKSPVIHNAAIGAAGIDGVYLAMPVEPGYAAFAAFMDYVAANPWLDLAGLSVTLPHKENALRWLDERGGRVERLARRIGAVNTLLKGESDEAIGPAPAAPWSGHNTDAAGALRALLGVPQLRQAGLKGKRADVLGAGGAARAVVAALLDEGCAVTLYNRTLERARALAAEFSCAARPWAERTPAQSDILVNCTSVGLWPAVDESPMPFDGMREGSIVFDTIYNPARTKLLTDSAARGCPTVSGVEMFLEQAQAQFRLWHRCDPPADAMRAALLDTI